MTNRQKWVDQLPPLTKLAKELSDVLNASGFQRFGDIVSFSFFGRPSIHLLVIGALITIIEGTGQWTFEEAYHPAVPNFGNNTTMIKNEVCIVARYNPSHSG